ncbi:uncharacterized protein LOC110859649 [Folsomia candida]|uniref:F-box domain-containing protein n=1 Tax=Folsomia candida TaxID=158441 RepID=A0A226DA22_FOLCA|nr:uncharacterized protein LOC110859649 [Folsomia candida]OXA42069.1 hypothetical protein Fcan01_23188 [Folsomia candida]
MGSLSADTSVQIALNNPIILTQILLQPFTPLKTCRLVSKFWNDIILSFPNPGLAIQLSCADGKVPEPDPIQFFATCFTLDARLTKRIHATCSTPLVDATLCVYSFTSKLIFLCDKFSDRVQILEVSLNVEKCLQSVYQVLKNCCPNLRQLRITCTFTNTRVTNFVPPEMREELEKKANLVVFTLSSNRVTEYLTTFTQLVVNASGNLREVTLPWGFCPDFGNSKKLASFTIAMDGVHFTDPVSRSDFNISRMINLIGGKLFTLKFANVEKPSTKNLKLTCVEDTLKNICNANNILAGVRNLCLIEIYEPSLLGGLRTAFPNLTRLQVDLYYRTGIRGGVNGMKLGVVLQTCRGWKGLKHLKLSLPAYPNEIGDIIGAMLDVKELFHRLKTFQLMTHSLAHSVFDLKKEEMDLFKQFLMAISNMERVSISKLYVDKETAENVTGFMVSNKMSVSKFSLIERPDYED